MEIGSRVTCIDARGFEGQLGAGVVYKVRAVGTENGRLLEIAVDGKDGMQWFPADRFAPFTATKPSVDAKPGANATQVGGSHYQGAIQTWDYIAANGIGYFEGNIIKYVSRWQKKGGVEDLKKARHYLDKLIEISASEVAS